MQTKLNHTKNDNAWKTIGRAKKREQSMDMSKDSKDTKKTDIKSTPPR